MQVLFGKIFQNSESVEVSPDPEEMREKEDAKRFSIKSIFEVFQETREAVKLSSSNRTQARNHLTCASQREKRVVLLKFTKEDLQKTGEIVPADADRRSAEYRTKIRQHYDSLKEQFPTLTCADYARANEPRLHERTFQGWCTKEYRTEDRNKIKARIKAKPEIKDEIDRRGYKDSFKGSRTRFTQADRYSLMKEWEEEKAQTPDLTTEQFCDGKPTKNMSQLFPRLRRGTLCISLLILVGILYWNIFQGTASP